MAGPAGKLVVAGSLAALLAVAAPGVASAAKKSKTISGGTAIGTVEATCPKGKGVTGGGFRVTQPTVDTIPVVYESRMVSRRTWRVSAQLADHGPSAGPARVTAFGYCREGAPATVERSATKTIPSSNKVGVATAECPGRKKAVAGGFETPPPAISGTAGTRNAVTGSFRNANGSWRVQAVSGVFGAASHTAYVYCAGKAPPSRSGTGEVTNPPGATQFHAGTARSAPCRRGTTPVSGGFKQRPIDFNPFTLRLAYPFASHRTGDRWLASAVQAGGGGATPATTTLTAIAYCR